MSQDVEKRCATTGVKASQVQGVSARELRKQLLAWKAEAESAGNVHRALTTG